MEIIYAPQAERFLEKCGPDVRKRIIKKMRFYASTAEPLEFAEHLEGSTAGQWRFRMEIIGRFAVYLKIQ